MNLADYRFKWLLFGMTFVIIAGCKVSFSFNPGKLPPDLESISIEQFENNAPIIIPTLSQDLSESVRDKFLSRSSFDLVERNGDINIFGEIIKYDIAPINIQGGDQAAENRLTITVKVRMECEKYPELNWEKSLSNFENFPTSQNISDVEEGLIEAINERLATDIFNEAFQNW